MDKRSVLMSAMGLLGMRGYSDPLEQTHVKLLQENRDAEYLHMCEKIEHDFRLGIPARKIAREYGISRQRVHTILKNRGL